MDTRLLDCALSLAADQAVTARIPAFAARVSGPALAAHVTAAMRAGLHGHYLCTREEPAWLAPAYQWALLLDELRTHERDHPGAGPHPATAEWAEDYGRVIPGDTCAAQLATVQRWDRDARRDRDARVIAYGTTAPTAAAAPSAIEQAIGARASDPDWGQRLTAALEDFSDCRWAVDLLQPPAQAAGS
jgi:hypothetical protein